MRHLPDWHLVIVGDGELRQSLRQQAVDAGVESLLALGATLVKGPFVTVYNARQVVLFDPDGHAFRLSHYIG